MLDERTVRLAAELADVGGRAMAAERLAGHLGARMLLILVEDPSTGAFLPAPGFPQTLPGGPAWREFLGLMRTPGVHHGRVGFPAAEPREPALAHAADGLALVLLGVRGAPGDALQILAPILPILPLIASTLRAEGAARSAEGELAAAQSHARSVEMLATALDAARAEVQQTVLQLERQTRAADEARQRAEEATRAKDEFLAMLGHELRNPLSPILTALQLMRLKNQTSREQEVIERQVASLTRLVDDLLDISRITRGKVELRRSRVELADVAVRAIEMVTPILENRRQMLQVRIPPKGLVVDADPSRLAQVLANLLTNAAKYSDPDTEIVFAAERSADHVRILVRDQGIGMTPEMLDRVFDVFVQHRQSLDRSQGGLGLGLAIVRSLVEIHGGTVTATSEGPGMGSEFVVTLPSVAGACADLPLGGTTEGTAVPVAAGRRARILIADDNLDAAGLLADALRALGYSVRTAPDGPSALREAALFHPHVALLDIGLPVMDGHELAERLRAQQGRALRLVAVTGYGQPEDRRRSERAGFHAHLVKPVALDQLHQLIEQLSVAKS